MTKMVKLIRKGIKIVDKIKNFVEMLWWVVPVVVAIAVAIAAAVKNFNKEDDTGHFEASNSESAKREPVQDGKQDSDGQRLQHQKMWSVQMEANNIDNEMTKLIGGDTGMLACKIHFQETSDRQTAEQYRIWFNGKQKELRRLHEQLEALKQENPSVRTLGDEEMYQKMMTEQL